MPASHRTCPFNATLDGQRTPAYTDLDNGTRWLQYDALLRPCQTISRIITPSWSRCAWSGSWARDGSASDGAARRDRQGGHGLIKLSLARCQRGALARAGACGDASSPTYRFGSCAPRPAEHSRFAPHCLPAAQNGRYAARVRTGRQDGVGSAHLERAPPKVSVAWTACLIRYRRYPPSALLVSRSQTGVPSPPEPPPGPFRQL